MLGLLIYTMLVFAAGWYSHKLGYRVTKVEEVTNNDGTTTRTTKHLW